MRSKPIVRSAVLLTALLGLAVMPAQAKTKGTVVPDAPATQTEDAAPGPAHAPAGGDFASIEAFKVCLSYAKGDVLAGETGKTMGWDTSDDGGESPYVRAYSGAKTFPNIGDANLFSLVESYPDTTFGYCRIDIQSPTGEAGVNALRDLPELAGGQMITNGDGTFGSWKGVEAEPQLLLLSHQTADAFVLQMTIITHRDGAAEAK